MQKKKGISLIVLVITIIVMIILASAIIMSLDNNNIFNKAEDAVEITNEKTIEEMATLKWMDGYTENLRDEELESYVMDYIKDKVSNLDDYVIGVTDTGVSVLKKENAWVYAQDTTDKENQYTLVKRGEFTLEIGDYISYSATGSDYTGNWQVLGASKEGNLLIISEGVTNQVSVKGEHGILYADKILDGAAKPYSKGYGAVRARNIRIEEINKVTGFVPETMATGNYGKEYSYYWKGDPLKVEVREGENITEMSMAKDSNVFEGGEFYYYNGTKLEKIKMDENASESNPQYICTMRYTSYTFQAPNLGLESGDKIYDLFFGRAYGYYAGTEVKVTGPAGLSGYVLPCIAPNNNARPGLILKFNGTENGVKVYQRPVVELMPNIQLDGSSEEGWTIVK